LLFVALLTTVVLLFITNPELLQDIWLWIVGFIGYIILMLEKGFKAVAAVVRGDRNQSIIASQSEPVSASPPPSNEVAKLEKQISRLEERLRTASVDAEKLGNCTITVLRYLDDGQTSLGLLFLRNKFFAYTLEDSFQAEKIAGESRIPAGIYPLRFNLNDTPLTNTYRQRFPWFKHHLEIEDIEGFDQVYVHIGNTHQDTRGCILIADGVTTTAPEKMITHSRLAYQRFYQRISSLLQVGEKVTIRILDEDWIDQAKLQPI